MEKGIVIKSTGSWYLVKRTNGEIIEARIRGKLRTKGLRTTNPVARRRYSQPGKKRRQFCYHRNR